MKKLMSIVLCLILLCTAVSAVAQDYTASADGLKGPVEMKVSFDGNTITAIEVVSHSETAGLSDPAFAKIPEAIIAGQTTDVETVSGATFTSNAIIAAVKDCVEQAGVTLAAAEVAAAVAEDEVLEYDVVVLGGGGAGIAAAQQAKANGASVLLLEKMARLGGSTMISGGIICATETDQQKALGVEDSVEALTNYYFNDRTRGKAEYEYIKLIASESANTVNWLEENGVVFNDTVTAGGHFTTPRLHSVVEYSGTGFILPLTESIKAQGVDIRLETPAHTLLTDENGNVTGVVATAADGHTVTVNAKSVVIATGGFDSNKELMRKYCPTYADEICLSHPGNTGDGLVMAMDIGADTVFKDGVIGIRCARPTAATGDPYNGLVWYPQIMMVDSKGARFSNESLDYPIYHSLLVNYGSPYYFMIFDGTQCTDEMVDELLDAGYAFKADTLEELAEKTFMDKETLLTSAQRYEALKGMADPDFGKDASLMSGLGEGPYYAVRVVPAEIGSLGGIKIDLDMHVLREDGSVIGGLYAAGECANGDFHYQEYLVSGTAISIAFTTGRIAGVNAATGK